MFNTGTMATVNIIFPFLNINLWRKRMNFAAVFEKRSKINICNMRKRTLFIISMTVLMCSCTGTKEKKDTQSIQVKTTTVTHTFAANEVTYAGTIEEESGADLSFASAGTIKSLNIHEGQNVAAGQFLGALDATTMNNGVVMAEATTKQAQESLAQAEDAYARMKMMHDNGSLPEIKWIEIQTQVNQARQMLRQAEASEKIARKGSTDTRLTAPFSGFISRKNSEVGQNVLPGLSVARLVRIDNVKLVLSIPEDEISKVSIGQKVAFSVSSLGGRSFMGIIKEKDIAADPISRSYKVKALVANADHSLLPGMVCDASIISNDAQKAIVIPANIVQIDIDNNPFVWIARNGKAEKVFVTLDKNVGNNVIVSTGLSDGMKVITEGQQKVYNGAEIKE